MAFLAEYATVFPFEALLAGERARKGISVAITWDDGYSSVYESAFSILRKYRFPATLYVTTGIVHEDSSRRSDDDDGLIPGLSMLTWKQIRELQHGGLLIGAHLVHHLDLRALTRESAVEELRSSRLEVERQTDTECRHFAYPFGLSKPRCAQWVREAEYRSAATTLHSPLPLKFDSMFVPRINIGADYDMMDFQAIVVGDWDYLAGVQLVKASLGLSAPVSLR